MTKRNLFASLLLAVSLVYSSSLPASYHADDWSHQWIPRTFSSPADIWNPAFPFNTSFRPVYLTYLWGLSWVSSHSIALARTLVIAIHLVAVWVVWQLANRCLGGPGRKAQVFSEVAALWFGIAFCHFEVPHALTNSETPGALLVLMTLLSLTAWWNKPSFLSASSVILTWLLALLCKEYALWIPLGLLVCQILAPRDQRASWKGLLGLLVPMGLVSMVYLWTWMRLDRSAQDMALLIQPTLSIEGTKNFLSSLVSLPLLDPFQGRWFGILHDRLGLPTGLLAILWGLMATVFVGVVGWGWNGLNRLGRGIGLGLILCPLILTCWLPGDPASRHLYLPSVGFGLFLAGAVISLRFESRNRAEGAEGTEKSGWGKSLALLLCGVFLVQGVGTFAVGWELARTTGQREAITDRLGKELQQIPSGERVYLSGLPERARVNMALYFLFPGRDIADLSPSPLLKEQPLETLRKSPPSNSEAVILDWEGMDFVKMEVSEFLEREAKTSLEP